MVCVKEKKTELRPRNGTEKQAQNRQVIGLKQTVSQPGLNGGSKGLGSRSAASAWGGMMFHKRITDGKKLF